MKTYRQGDVLFKLVETMPVEGKRRNSGHIVEGEATGHVHRVAEQDLAQAEVMECGNELFVRVTAEGGVSIVHEEHRPVRLPRGDYEIVRQREYAPQSRPPLIRDPVLRRVTRWVYAGFRQREYDPQSRSVCD